jgi:hypothetical protein
MVSQKYKVRSLEKGLKVKKMRLPLGNESTLWERILD